MLNTTMLKRFLTGLILLTLSQLIYTNAYSQPQYVTPAQLAGIKILGSAGGCLTCHTVDSLPAANKTNVKSGYQAALGNQNYATLKAFIEKSTVVSCVLPKILNPVNKTCVVATTKTAIVGLANGVAKTDVWSVTCPAPSTSLSVAVKDLASALNPKITIRAQKNNKYSTASTDSKNGDAIYSPLKKLPQGSGVYSVTVFKDASGAVAANKKPQSYTALFSCQNTAGTKVADKFLKITQKNK